MKKGIIIAFVIVIVVMVVATIGGSFYMLDFALAPDAERTDTAASFRQLVEKHPEVKPWLDSLNQRGALCDTFINMPSGERHHGYFIRQATDSTKNAADSTSMSRPVAIVVHGWRDTAIKFMTIARIYEQAGYHVLMPDLHAHGLSEGEAVQMGWKDRKDVLHWMTVASKLFGTNDFVIHGVSMGAATTMCVSGEKMPECVKTVRFVEDCGYTSVWDEFSYELKEEFGLSDFPITAGVLARRHPSNRSGSAPTPCSSSTVMTTRLFLLRWFTHSTKPSKERRNYGLPRALNMHNLTVIIAKSIFRGLGRSLALVQTTPNPS